MPRGDRMGPQGFGPQTGRAAGYCAGFATPGYMNRPGGRFAGGFGAGFGGGRGRGWRHWYYATGVPGWQRAAPDWYPPYPPAPSKKEELEALRDQVSYLEKDIESARGRIKELEQEEGSNEDRD